MNNKLLRLCFLVYFIFHINVLFSQNTNNKATYERYNLKQSHSQKIGRENLDKESNAIRSIYNEKFVSRNDESTDKIAMSYLKSKHSDFNLSKDLSDVKLIKTKNSPGGKYAYFEQTMHGIPVYASCFTVALNKGDTVVYAKNEFRDVKKYGLKVINPKITPEEAIALAKKHLDVVGEINSEPLPKLVYFESEDVGLELAWQVNIIADKPFGCWLIMVNTENRRIIHSSNEVMNIDVSGMVYNPNPLTSAQLTSHGGNFVDNNDATNSDLDNERIQVTLRDITYENGYYSLKGPYCNVSDSPTLTDKDAFNFTRDQDGFEAVMAYYHIDMAGRYVESLGYFDSLYLGKFNVEALSGQSSSSYWPGAKYDNYKPTNPKIILGNGEVDDAEDAEIIWHEYGHALQRAIGSPTMLGGLNVKEGSSDYWACSYSRSVSFFNWVTLFEWGADGYTRRADVDWVYPNYPYKGIESHHDGQLWSSVLMDIWGDLGRTITDMLFLETHLLWGVEVDILDAAEAFMLADRQLYNGGHLCTIIEHFSEYGLTEIQPSIVIEDETLITDDFFEACSIEMNNVSIENSSTITADVYASISMQNTIVDDNSELIVHAMENVSLNQGFEVKLGAELSIE